MNPVEDRVVQALRARAEEADMSQSTLNRNYAALMNRVSADRSRRMRLLLAAAAVVVVVAAGGIGLWLALDRASGNTSESVPADRTQPRLVPPVSSVGATRSLSGP